MSRGQSWSGLSVVLLALVLGGFLYWYWSPALPFGIGSREQPTSVTKPLQNEVDVSATREAQRQVVASPIPTPLPVLAPFCAPGRSPAFVLGFARLKERLGPIMGEPIECEHVNPSNGDTLQQTTTGLAMYRPANGELEFTNGWEHWALVGDQLLTWEGDARP
jgi:hypothetical protein